MPDNFTGSKKSNPSPRRMITMVVLVLLSFFLIERGASVFLGKIVLSSNFRYSVLYAGKSKAEVLVLGNSRGVNAIYAPEFKHLTGLDTMNLSYNGLSARIGYCILSDYLELNTHPRHVILEITNVDDSNTLIRDLKLYSGFSRRLQRLLSEESPTIAFVDHFVRLYKFNGQMFLRALYYLGTTDQSWINRYTIDRDYAQKTLGSITTSGDPPSLNADNLRALNDTIQLLAENEIGYSLIISPSLQGLINQDRIQDWKQAIEDQLHEAADILNFSSSIDDLDAFADGIHLNYTGSRIFLPILIDNLEI